MNDYKAVPSGLEISRRVIDCLEASAPADYLPDERTKAICAVNDILQGRSSRSTEELLTMLEQYGDGRLGPAQRDIQNFLKQKDLLGFVYDKTSRGFCPSI